MALRTKHGNAKNYDGPGEVLETLPVEELPAGLPEPARTENPRDRGGGGRFAPGNSLASRGGAAKRGKAELAERLGFRKIPEGTEFRKVMRAAVAFRRATCKELARTVGGGVCGTIPSSFVASAALCMAWSRWYFDIAASGSYNLNAAKLVARAQALAEASSSLLRQAHEYCAREAQAREKADDTPAPWEVSE